MAIIRKRHIKGINLDPTDLTAEDLSNAGDLAYDSNDGKLKYKDSTNTREVLNTDESQTLSNKTLDNTSIVNYDNTIENVISLSKQDGITPVENVQEALDSIKRALDNQNEASEIDYTIKTGTGDNWNSFEDEDVTTVDLALDELASRVDIDEQSLSNHLTTSSAHLAQNIRLAPFINIGGDLKENVYTGLTGLNAELALKALADNGTITNATIQTSSIEDSSLITSSIQTPSRLDVKQDTESNLETYATTASDGQIVFATDTKKMFQVVDNALQSIGGGGSTQFEITQATHGFVVGNGIYHNGTSFVSALADSADTLASYVVVEVVDADTFVAADFGRLEVNLLTNPNSLAAGTYYYLSDSSAGSPTNVEPSIFSNPLFYVESVDATDVNNQIAVLQIKVYRPESVEADEVFAEITQSVNNSGVDIDITGLILSGASYRSAVFSYSIYRSSDSEELSQVGQLMLSYKTTANTWSLSDTFGGDDAGVEFSIDPTSGQISYTSSTLDVNNYTGVLKIRGSEVFRV